jgi:tetratricopeptide (TPR) repeat protein
VAPPTPKEVALLREALATFYGVDRDVIKAQELLSQAIEAWQKQAPDERAALYRVRGDCYMALLKPQEAQKDYTIAIDLLEGSGGDLADPSELPAATYVDVCCLSSLLLQIMSSISLFQVVFMYIDWVGHVLFEVRA